MRREGTSENVRERMPVGDRRSIKGGSSKKARVNVCRRNNVCSGRQVGKEWKHAFRRTGRKMSAEKEKAYRE